MIFNDLTYFLLFLAPSVVAFHSVSPRFKAWVLAGFGLGFFVYYSYRHFGGAWGSACVLLFVWEMLLTRLYRPGSRWCLVGIAQALLILIAFKYVGLMAVLGISFFTFEFIHVATDVYVGRLDRSPTPGTYAAFILFFPTMVAGPIKRYQDFEPQLALAHFDAALASQGITRILAGLAKKHVLADTLSIWSDQLGTGALYAAPRHVIAGWLLAYTFKIYFDFSAYSDIAIGAGNLFGLKVPENFNWPYLSANIAEFWRRWHISLGRWIYDYIFAPLSLAFGGAVPVPVALIITFIVCGIWHGADFHFAMWGLWHGMLLAGYHLWRVHLKKHCWAIPNAAAVAITFSLVVLGYAFFALDTSRAIYVVGRIVGAL